MNKKQRHEHLLNKRERLAEKITKSEQESNLHFSNNRSTVLPLNYPIFSPVREKTETRYQIFLSIPQIMSTKKNASKSAKIDCKSKTFFTELVCGCKFYKVSICKRNLSYRPRTTINYILHSKVYHGNHSLRY